MTKDEAQAAEWYRRAAEQGVPDAMHNLGLMLAQGRGVAKDEALAVEWCRCAAEKGLARAMYSLAGRLERGQGVTQDEAQAAKWYRRISEQGVPDGMINLGVMKVVQSCARAAGALTPLISLTLTPSLAPVAGSRPSLSGDLPDVDCAPQAAGDQPHSVG
ncbi:MAG: sel1 repeat family protein [Planctomycetes bacterium]|nr:sel1 repeat family protein [Planctomycetota bacterium]